MDYNSRFTRLNAVMGEHLASKAIQKYIGHYPETVVRDAYDNKLVVDTDTSDTYTCKR